MGDVAVEETFNNAIPLLLACYRQRQIKLTLQGQIDLEDESEDDEINVIRDFLESKLKHSDQDK